MDFRMPARPHWHPERWNCDDRHLPAADVARPGIGSKREIAIFTAISMASSTAMPGSQMDRSMFERPGDIRSTR